MRRRKVRKDDDGWAEKGGYMNAKIQKLEHQFSSDNPNSLRNSFVQHKNLSNIFEGVSIFVNGYTRPTAFELRSLMINHGGAYCEYYSRKKVTHIIASQLAKSKQDKVTTQKIVRPEWITESIEAGQCLSVHSFLLMCKTSQQTISQFKMAPALGLRLNRPNGKIDSSRGDEGYRLTEKVSDDSIFGTSRNRPPASSFSVYNDSVPMPLVPSESNSTLSVDIVDDSSEVIEGDNFHDQTQVVDLDESLNLDEGPSGVEKQGVIVPTKSEVEGQSSMTSTMQCAMLSPIKCIVDETSDSDISVDFPLAATSELDVAISEVQSPNDSLDKGSADSDSDDLSDGELMAAMNSYIEVEQCRLKILEVEPGVEKRPEGKSVENLLCHANQPFSSGISSYVSKTKVSSLPPQEEIVADILSPEIFSDEEAPSENDNSILHTDVSASQLSREVKKGNQRGLCGEKLERREELESKILVGKNSKVDGGVKCSLHNCTPEEVTNPPIRKSKEDPQSRVGKAGDPNFLSDYYANSRLHHLSTWSTDLRELVLTFQSLTEFPGLRKLKETYSSQESINYGKVIMHVDMDCFFVSVGILSRSHLVGKPVVVTHSEGRDANQKNQAVVEKEAALYRARNNMKGGLVLGQVINNQEEKIFTSKAEIASCSYEARKFGVKNGMYMGQAKQLCPELIPIPYDFEAYHEISEKLYSIVSRYTNKIEAVSCDEMLADISHILGSSNCSPDQFASALRSEILQETKCHASVGMGPNVLLAKMATKAAKPDGQKFIEQREAAEFMKSVSVRTLPGVGRSIERKLFEISISSCEDLANVGVHKLREIFGQKTGTTLDALSRGVDGRTLQIDKQRKVVSTEVNYGIRFKKIQEAEKFLRELSVEVERRLVKSSCKGQRVTLKLKVRAQGAPEETSKFMGHGVCDNFSKSANFACPVDSAELMASEAIMLLSDFKLDIADIRGVGLAMSRLVNTKTKLAASSIASFLHTRTRKGEGKMATAKERQNSRKVGKEFRMQSSTPLSRKTHPRESGQEDPRESGREDPRESGREDPKESGREEPKESGREDPKESGKDDSLSGSKHLSDWWPVSLSQIDTNVLEELPGDLRSSILSEMENYTKGATSHPAPDNCLPSSSVDFPCHANLPCLSPIPAAGDSPEELQPPHPSSFSDPVSAEMARMPLSQQSLHDSQEPGPSRRSPVDAESDFVELPSLSQVDPDYLSSLPPDIRGEVLAYYDRRKVKEDVTVATAKSSEWKCQDAEKGYDLPNLSQIDLGCMAALPEELKREVHLYYKNVKQFRPAASPRKNQVLVKTSPVRRRRCRSPRQAGLLSPLGGTKQTNLFPENAESDDDNSALSTFKSVTLEGLQEWSDIRRLLSLWVDLSDEPSDVDAEIISNFLCQSVLAKNLPIIPKTLLFLKTKIPVGTAESGKTAWTGFYEKLLNDVQMEVYHMYGSFIKL